MVSKSKVSGRNGVAVGEVTAQQVVRRLPGADEAQGEGAGYRTYEVHQRERVGESTEKIKPIQLVSDDFRRDPYPLLKILRENYPFYRDWLSNSYWVTPYNDVTSVFVDEANFESRSKLWRYDLLGYGGNLGTAPELMALEERLTDAVIPQLAERVVAELAARQTVDLAIDFAGRLALELQAELLAVPVQERDLFASLFWRMQRGCSWQPALRKDGRAAMVELEEWLGPVLTARSQQPGEDYLSAMLQLQDGVTARDVVVTLLERDHETLHGALANMFFQLLSHEEEFAKARSDRRLMKLAYLETLRHSTPVLSADRFARHEVERFGKLIPAGARLTLSAAAGNRDATVFKQPDQFIIDRKDLCQREPRGQYRADGLATGIAFGLGKPSMYPALPEDRPRSRYALTRDVAVEAAWQLCTALPNMRLAPDVQPTLSSLTVGEMQTCWHLPVVTA